ncbi:uncharacterized protein MONBRDRAFT_35780 [Monosiga brevicollis MX1]|uniref:Uncharacterized protein n=1 Tax=Monosiga brevicollis TaxID=81824 RepID=A9URS5_MONBE|nr:uncharacterized protein MONBRDRAFT_35780 [Monosiga brevicollis MX1]EDQ91978.1 predicted protein [Monosiga brevicollis MX1]|eukprot:XP_001743264.1 hypothetical protein [Monosiga brevicollis MX1]
MRFDFPCLHDVWCCCCRALLPGRNVGGPLQLEGDVQRFAETLAPAAATAVVREESVLKSVVDLDAVRRNLPAGVHTSVFLARYMRRADLAQFLDPLLGLKSPWWSDAGRTAASVHGSVVQALFLTKSAKLALTQANEKQRKDIVTRNIAFLLPCGKNRVIAAIRSPEVAAQLQLLNRVLGVYNLKATLVTRDVLRPPTSGRSHENAEPGASSTGTPATSMTSIQRQVFEVQYVPHLNEDPQFQQHAAHVQQDLLGFQVQIQPTSLVASGYNSATFGAPTASARFDGPSNSTSIAATAAAGGGYGSILANGAPAGPLSSAPNNEENYAQSRTYALSVLRRAQQELQKPGVAVALDSDLDHMGRMIDAVRGVNPASPIPTDVPFTDRPSAALASVLQQIVQIAEGREPCAFDGLSQGTIWTWGVRLLQMFPPNGSCEAVSNS